MTLMFHTSDNQTPLPEVPQASLGRDLGASMYADASQFKAATAAPTNSTADAHLAPLSIDGDKCTNQPESFMQKLERWGTAAMYWEQGELAPKNLLEPPKACPAEPAKPGDADPAKPATPQPLPSGEGEGGQQNTVPAPEVRLQIPPDQNFTGSADPGTDGKGPVVRLGQLPYPYTEQPTGPSATLPQGAGPEIHVGPLPLPGQGKAPDAPLTPDAPPRAADVPPVPAKPATPDQPGDIQGEIQKNVGKSVIELEPGINPRLGCARMASHILHEADPSFPETNNSAEFRRLLKEHGYEEVTVKPGDQALAQGQAGDVIIGRRPDGMPSHAAISMGDGKVFNNNSDSGKGQVDSIDQFNQGMHDSKGHWNKNGFADVTIFRKKAQTAPAAQVGVTNA